MFQKLGREQNVAVFKDTERLCKSEKQLVESIRKSIAGQKLILESENIECPKLMDAADWYKVNVITCAAPNLRIRPENSYNTGDGNKAAKIKDKDLLALHEKRLRRILDVAVSEGNDTIILGAFGCGAFENNPEVVAMTSRNVIKEYLHAFKTIEYAIYCSPRDERNFKVFERVLRR